MNSEICEKLSVFCMGLFAVTSASAAGAGAVAIGGAGALLAVPALWRSYHAWSDCAEKRAVSQAAKAALKAHRDSARQNHDLPAGSIAPAEAALASVIDLITIDPARLTKAHWEMAALPGLIVDAAANRSEEFADHSPEPQAAHNRALLAFLAGQVLAALQAQPGFEASVMPAFRQDVAGRLARMEGKFDRVLAQKDVEAALAEARTQLKATNEQLQAILELMLKRGVEPDQFARALLEATANWLSANPRLQGSSGDNLAPELAELRQQAQTAYDSNQVEEFYEINERIVRLEEQAYARVLEEQREIENLVSARKDLLIASLEEKQEAAHAALNATGVASALVRKLELVATEASELFQALRAVQDEWYIRGRDKGLNFDLEVSIELARLNENSAAGADQRGVALNDLGAALRALGQRESGAERLEQASNAYRAVLEEHTRKHSPFDWAMAQNNLGTVLTTLGEREIGTGRLEKAVAAYRLALEVRTRECAPDDWAISQTNLGNALATLGEREIAIGRLEEAVTAYRLALEERTREIMPLAWAMTQNNLGNALWALGVREKGTERLKAAVTAYRLALEERTREIMPLAWAMTQNNLGNALWTLGLREKGVERLEAAVTAYRLALEERTRERAPLDWAMTQTNLGNAFWVLGQRKNSKPLLEKAITAHRSALEDYTRKRVPLDWAMAQSNLGNALMDLGGCEGDTGVLSQAIIAHRLALEERRREQVPLLWAETRENMAFTFKEFFEQTGADVYRVDAIKAARDALEVYREGGAEFYIEKAERLLAQLEGDADG